MSGMDAGGNIGQLRLAGAGSRAHNPAFDVTPAGLVSALVTEHGSFRGQSGPGALAGADHCFPAHVINAGELPPAGAGLMPGSQ